MKLFYFGHHKCGSTWIYSIITSLCKLLDKKQGEYNIPAEYIFDIELAINEYEFITIRNSEFHHFEPIINEIKAFHVIRDPRDIVVSAYYSHLNSHQTKEWPELIYYRKKLTELSKEEGLFFVMDYLSSMRVRGSVINIYDNLDSWDYNKNNILEIKFEDLIINPYNNFLDIFEFLGYLNKKDNNNIKTYLLYLISELPKRILKKYFNIDRKIFSLKNITPWQLLNIIYQNSFKFKTSGRSEGIEDINSHYRKGITGDWKNHFTESHINYFDDHYGQLLNKLGYIDK